MNRLKTTVGVLALAGALAACEDHLVGPGLTTNPNQPSEATLDQLFHGVQVASFVWHTGDLARMASMYTQHMSGVDRQYQTRATYAENDEAMISWWWRTTYVGGGLVDMRLGQEQATALNDRTTRGILGVWEGYRLGMAASVWGDIPYSEAVTENPQPALDPQHQAYALVQSVLSEAIADLQSGTGAGPGAADLVYGGNRALWVEAANTLKARFYMHWVEAQLAGGDHAQRANVACGGNCLQQAVAAAGNGISAVGNNMRSWHSTSQGEQNLWHQFMFIQRQGMLAAGSTLVNLLQQRNDPRLTIYFEPRADGQMVGAPQGAAGDWATLNRGTRGAAAFRQPMVTYQENQFILAEANFRLGSEGTARTHLNNARVAEGLPGNITATGEDLLREIALEKYIHMFQNMEAWNDFQRTCYPRLPPPSGATEIIGRWFYSNEERNANPNIPEGAAQPVRNPNDVAACPTS
jgi:starch-binding outer membrane protein, SusD/RagB family